MTAYGPHTDAGEQGIPMPRNVFLLELSPHSASWKSEFGSWSQTEFAPLLHCVHGVREKACFCSYCQHPPYQRGQLGSRRSGSNHKSKEGEKRLIFF